MRKQHASSFAIILLLTGMTALAQHEGDLIVCVNGQGQLRLSPFGFDPSSDIVVLPDSAGLFLGFSSDEPGFDDLEVADEEADIYPFAAGHEIGLEVISLDPALLIWNPGLQRFDAGEIAPLGSTDVELHTHLIWHINTRSPSPYDPLRDVWRATVRLVDTAGGYAPSESFVLLFRANIECIIGDVDADGEVNNFDIDPFVAILTDPAAATAVQRCAADVNLDGYVNNFDIDSFVAALVGN
ncbi:MAG: hypothetical protein JNG88_00650 [Phycisphaerales bacterium]|nr:hypothetical protein [Phycisphaerales bacterium]